MVENDEAKKLHWNPLTKKQENTFGFITKKEIVNFATKIIRKHAPEELKNYPIKTGWLFKRYSWANISHINAQPEFEVKKYANNVINLKINKNLLHPEIPLIFKKDVLVHELTHLFSQRGHTFIHPATYRMEMDPNKRLKEGFDSDEKIYKATEGHPQEFADQYHKLLKNVMGIDVNEFPQFKYIAGKNKKEYEEISKVKDLLNVWHENNFIWVGLSSIHGWLGFSQKDLNDYLQKQINIHEKLRKEISGIKVSLKSEEIENGIKEMMWRNEIMTEYLQRKQQRNKNFTWDLQNAIDKLENENKKWENLLNQKKEERKVLEAKEEKKKEIERQKEMEKDKKESIKQLKKEKLWETNPPDENDDDYWEYKEWKRKHDHSQKIKLTENQLDQDIDEYFELKNSNKEISKELKDRIGNNLWHFNELTNDFYYHEKFDELRNDENFRNLIDEYEHARYEKEREEEEDDWDD